MARTLATSGFAVLTEAPSLLKAHWIAGAVEAAGIPTHVEEDNLADEFAMSRKLMGILPIRVLVPAERLEEARTVFLGLSQPIPIVDEEDDAELDDMAADRKDRTITFAVIFIAIFFGAPLLGYAIVSGWLGRLFGA